MNTNSNDLHEEAGHGNRRGRGVLIAGFIVLVAIAALVATSVAGHPAGSPQTTEVAAPSATADIPYLPEQFESQSKAMEPAVPAATF